MSRRKSIRLSVLLSVNLDELARSFVGDGKSLNGYFVTDGASVVTVTFDYPTARDHYRALARRRPLQECALEDRQTGVIASVSPIEDDGPLRFEDAPEEDRA